MNNRPPQDRLGPRITALNAFAAAAIALAVLLTGVVATSAQNSAGRFGSLSRDQFKSGATTLRAFEAVAETARDSVVKLKVNGGTVALGAVIDASGSVITKASEITQGGELTCEIAPDEESPAEVVAIDDENDVALVRVHTRSLAPIRWARQVVGLGEWAITPGANGAVQAVGIISAPPRKIPPPRALIGVQLDFSSSVARIGRVMPGLGAERAGLRADDVILSVNGDAVESGEALIAKLKSFREGQTVQLRIRREDETFDASIKLAVPKPEQLGSGPDRQERLNRLGTELSERAEGFHLALQHDTVLQPWQCGGPLLNLDGEAVGINIARAGRVASYALPASLVREIVDRLKQQQPNPTKKEPDDGRVR